MVDPLRLAPEHARGLWDAQQLVFRSCWARLETTSHAISDPIRELVEERIERRCRNQSAPLTEGADPVPHHGDPGTTAKVTPLVAVFEIADRIAGRLSHRRPVIPLLRVCEHPFVTAQGSARTQFMRALERRNLIGAEMALREMGAVSLLEALDYLALLAELRPDRLEAAAVRWHGRLELESSVLTLAESQLALAALANLGSNGETVQILRRLVRRAQPTLVPKLS